MARKKAIPQRADDEYRESLIGQYETITGRDWYKIEELMKQGDIAATLIFVADHIIRKIDLSTDLLKDELGEKLENVWGQVADLNAAARKTSRPR